MVILIGDYVQLTSGRNRELMDRNGVQTETENNGEKQGMDRNGKTTDRNGMRREMEN